VLVLIFYVILSIWAIVDVAWYCGDALPLYCTNGITATILTSYWVAAISLWIVTILWGIAFIVFIFIRRANLRLMNRFSGIEQKALFELLFQSGKFPTEYVTGIGASKQK